MARLKTGPNSHIEVELGEEVSAWRGPHYGSRIHSDPQCGSRGRSVLAPVTVHEIEDGSHHYAYQGRALWGCGTCGPMR